MARPYYDLPSLTALSVFEVTARHSSLKAATAELNVTSGAISRQIKALEAELGVPLFLRTGRGVTLTPAGEELYATLAAGFSRFADVTRNLKQGCNCRNVTIASTDTTASMWLVPRMPDFWQRHPDIMIDHQLVENSVTFRPEVLDLRIRHGLGGWLNEVAEPLFDEWLYPVCSPDFAQRHAGAQVGDLLDLPLIDIDWVAPDWVTWVEALLQGGVRDHARQSRRFGKFSLALQAATAGQGVVLGWHRMVAPMVERGELVRLTDLIFPAPGRYWLTRSQSRPLSPAAEALHGWILEQAAVERSRGSWVGS
ncbi:LysR substrate-binding domain-containing protein [Pseudogemmobacter humi]|uniref:Glycine cleavage system transcriptional activator n=1 Tax=Pseudogemmobacter humi TaxID=2483812 RepID=A0A3P5WWA7_9RHOB|nr:LysR substrate-binding domain-containing protein [Pseudogemmobacter humi]VDC19211.1 Glycine cleavage system transcriptional activator [Pseudogemmobacter humi]